MKTAGDACRKDRHVEEAFVLGFQSYIKDGSLTDIVHDVGAARRRAVWEGERRNEQYYR